MARFAKRLGDREIRLTISDAAKDWLGEVGYDPTFGARPLKRAIQKHLENRLAEDLLAGRYEPGDTVVVDAAPAGAGLSFKHERATGPSAHVEA
jgi:ATP-dependent Clp protease ATP-binding subunit ClpB